MKNTGFHAAKNVEDIVSSILKNEVIEPHCSDTNKKRGIIIAGLIRKEITTKFPGLSIISVHLKPIVEHCNFGKKNEPKTDLVVNLSNGVVMKISIKTKISDAYTQTTNSAEDAVEILFLDELENGKEYHKMLKRNLVKLTNFSVSNKPGGWTQADTISYVKRKFTNIGLESKSMIGFEDRIMECESKILQLRKQCVDNNDTSYKDKMREAEGEIQIMWAQIFANEKHAKKVLYNMITGENQFGKNSLATADYIVGVDGIHYLNSPDCEFIDKVYCKYAKRKKIGRLQNVPRRGFPTSMVKDLSIPAEEIAMKFVTADMSMKL